MIGLKLLRESALRLSSLPQQPAINLALKRHRRPSCCDQCLCPPSKKPCFDINEVLVERGNQCHAKMIRSFLYAQYWPREPSVAGLWMALDSKYLDILSDKYANSGDRWLAFEFIKRTGERKLIGVLVANQIQPWAADELEEWAHYTISRPERHRMYFIAHCLRGPNLFKKYHVDYIYDVEILGTAAEVTGQGVGTLLLKKVLQHAEDVRHPVVQVVSVNDYATKICKKCGMKMEWQMNYSDYVDNAGQRVFFPRRPHHTASVFVKHNDPKLSLKLPCEKQYFDDK